MMRSAIVFCAAGSGGHVYAAIATLKAFQSEYPTLAKEILFVGGTLTMEGEVSMKSIEERLCERSGVPFQKIRMGKLQRTFSFNSIRLALLAVVGFWDAWILLRRIKPKVIAAFGGYVTLPIVIIGKLLGAKIVLHEQTSSIGLTNKVLQPFVDIVAVTFSSSLPYFRKQTKVVGLPLLPHIHNIKEYDHLLKFLVHEKVKLLEEPEYLEQLKWIGSQKGKLPILLMSGGSQGSHFLNDQIKAILPELLKEMIVILQVGQNEIYHDFELFKELIPKLPAELSRRCVLRRFLFEEYGFLMHTADLFLGRSGAGTVYQVGMKRTRGLFVPIPWVTKNEQFTNAMVLTEKGFAAILEQSNCTPEILLQEIRKQIEISLTEQKHRTATDVPIFPDDADRQLALEIGKLAV